MLATLSSAERLSSNALSSTQDLASSPESAFALICEVEKWPLWLSFLTSARRVDEHAPLTLGSEIVLRSAIPGEAEEFYEVDQLLDGHIISLVGAYSVRRRIDFRIERKSDRSKLLVRVDYPAYGGVVGAFIDRLTARRRLESALDESLLHFKGLVEYRDVPKDELLADF
jgi:uncharacterized membrane protein